MKNTNRTENLPNLRKLDNKIAEIDNILEEIREKTTKT